MAVIAISILCILLIMGYRFNTTDRKLEQGGLLQFRSAPSGAQVRLNDVLLGSNTPTKRDIASGVHRVTMQKAGYKPWTRSVKVRAGELRWLNYTRLIPEQIKTKPVMTLAEGLSEALATPDRRYMAVLDDVNASSIKIVDMRNSESIVSRTIKLETTLLTRVEGQPSKLSIAEWDFGSRYILLTHTTGDYVEYIRLDRSAEDGAVRNITKEFNLNFSNVHFAGTSGNSFYALTGTDLRRVDISAGSLTQPVISGVLDYRLYGDSDIAFVALRDGIKMVGVYMNNKESLVRTIPPEQATEVDLTRYYSNYYLAISTPEGVDIIKDPAEVRQSTTSVHAVLKKTSHDYSWLDFGTSGRFILAGDNKAYSVYDLETEEQFTIERSLLMVSPKLPLWVDDYYLASVDNDTVSLLDYDGQNISEITKNYQRMPVFLSSNGRYLFSFSASDTARSLQASRLILEN